MKYTWLMIMLFSLASCGRISSPVDSTRPFDAKQASALLQQNAPTKPAQQKFLLTFPQMYVWKKTNYNVDELGNFIIFTPPDETAYDWTQSLQARMLPYEKVPNVNADAYAQAEIEFLKENCKLTASDILIQNNEISLIYLAGNMCQHSPDYWQMSKIFNGSDGVYSLRYLAHKQTVDQTQFEKMARIVKTARLYPAQ